MRVNKKKFIYLISPNKISINFYQDLNKVLKTSKIGYFQMRFKKYSFEKKVFMGKKIRKICRRNKVKFIVNDDPILAKKLNADGCHLGQKDITIKEARKIIGNKIIGITCHNSIKLAKEAIKNNANYIAFGTFFPTKTKKTIFKSNIKTLNKAKKLANIPIVAIGGINYNNYKKLLLNNANFLAISGYIWSNKKYKPVEAVESLK